MFDPAPHCAPPVPAGVLQVAAQIRDAAERRRVVVGFPLGPSAARTPRLEIIASVYEAMQEVLHRLALHPDAMVCRTVAAGARCPALLLRPARDADPAAWRVVAFVAEGLSELDVQLGLLWAGTHLTPPGSGGAA